MLCRFVDEIRLVALYPLVRLASGANERLVPAAVEVMTMPLVNHATTDKKKIVLKDK